MRQSGRDGKSFLLAATALGAGSGSGDTADAMPEHGGVLRFVKCWPGSGPVLVQEST
jgi:hypothetical protein